MKNKKLHLTLFFCLQISFSFHQVFAAAPVNDFEPPKGPLSGQVEGPWDKRLLTAYSDDGLTFTKTNQVISDQANVPDLMMLPDGRIILYYTAGSVGDKKQETVAAISADDGRTWTFKYIEIAGLENGPTPADPDIVKLDDGTFRLFYTCGDRQSPHPKIFWADSKDGIHFVKGGVAFEQADEPVMDSFTVKIGDTWHMYTLGRFHDKLWHATSKDGKQFSLDGKVTFTADGEFYFVGNEIKLADGSLRLYGFSMPKQHIRSFITRDGYTWKPEAGVRLEISGNQESTYLRDPAVMALPNGKYLMVYVTRI